jgi:uncharacterized protein (DUF2147 family)
LGDEEAMKALAIMGLAALSATAAQGQERPTIEGLWRNPIGSAIIAIAPCGGALCGKVVWASERGKREAVKGARNVVGTTVLTGLALRGDRWWGTLFIPDDNIRVAAKLQQVGRKQLKLTGCAFVGLFCRTQIWTRADGPLPRTD